VTKRKGPHGEVLATGQNSILMDMNRIRRETNHKKLVKLVDELICAIAEEEKKLPAKK